MTRSLVCVRFYFDTSLVLEKGDTRLKICALKKVIQLILGGEKMSPTMLMTVIRFVMPSQDHTIKKLLLVFWEVVPKYSADGKMLHEMILVCDAYRRVRKDKNDILMILIRKNESLYFEYA